MSSMFVGFDFAGNWLLADPMIVSRMGAKLAEDIGKAMEMRY